MESGTRLGPYEIIELLGKGGMGEVYRARDSRLDRDVALKVLPEGIASDPDTLARFDREARALAALNHPHIAQVYGLEQGDSTVIVMELVEGEDLAVMLERGALDLADALPIARQIADALEAAHEAGIVHRDLKPANVKVRPDGTVKVLDFGLAKVTDPTSSASGSGTVVAESPTLMSPAVTGVGMIMGTAAYMSPEQARGKPVDRRADVWAFGCVLFEMLSGRRAFGGDDVSMTLASVLKKDIDWGMLPADTPAPVRRMLERCFEVEPRSRYQSIGDARVEIEEWTASGFGDGAAAAGTGGAAESGAVAWWQRPAALLTGALVLLAVGAAAAWLGKPVPEPALRIVQIDERGVAPAWMGDANLVLVSPDGTAVLFRRDLELWLRRLDEPEARLLAEGVEAAAFSPDGNEVVIGSRTELLRMSLASGSTTKLAEVPAQAPYGIHWGASGRVLQSRGGDFGLQQVDLSTGESASVLKLGATDTRFLSPWELPNGDVMFSMLSRGRIEVFDGETRHSLYEVASATVESAVYAPSGHVVWAQWGTNEGVWAAPYAVSSRSFTGEPVQLSEVAGSVSVSRNGLLAIYPRATLSGGEAAVVLVARDGATMRELLPSRPALGQPRLSPDGSRLAITWQSGSGSTRVFVYDLERDISVELGAGAPGNNFWPEWLPDGSGVVYLAGASDVRSVMLEDAAGSPAPKVLAADVARNSSISVSADGRYVLYGGIDGDIWYVETAGGDPIRFRETDDIEDQPALSPDGRTIAYSRVTNTGTSGLFVERFPDGGNLQPVDIESWDHPRWKHDGTELYYEGSRGLTAISFDPETGLLTSRPETLFGGLSLLGSFDVTPDGQFIVPRQEVDEFADAPRLPILIENWPKLLEAGRRP